MKIFEKHIPAIRKVGLVLIFVPSAVTIVAEKLERGPGMPLYPFLWFFVLIFGIYLASLRTEKEKEEEKQNKRDRYSKTIARFGANRVRFALKASVVGILALFPVALLSLLSGAMYVFWFAVVLIGGCIAFVVRTDNPDKSILREDSNQS